MNRFFVACALFGIVCVAGAAGCDLPPGGDPVPAPVDSGDDGGTPSCSVDGDCPFGEECTDGTCATATTDVGDDGCTIDADCPASASCALTTGRCVPDAAVPPAQPGAPGPCRAGETRTCGEKIGECEYGTELCVDEVWSGVCEGGRGPAAESCNGLDDDCDGDPDEDLGLGDACVSGLGVCQQPGFLVCTSDGATACSASALPADGRVELCGNGADDDCDGEDDAVEFADLGEACVAGLGLCARPGTVVCAGDGAGTVCDATPGAPGAVDLCGNGVDDDCNGTADDAFPDIGGACTVGGACPGPGTQACAPDLLDVLCVASSAGAETVCNGLDDDADSCADDGFPVGTACASGSGACRVTGNLVCSAAQDGTTCDAVAGNGTAELCGNTVDEDCDGLLNNGFNLGGPCTVGVGSCQRSGVVVCGAAGAAVCSATAGAPSAEQCGNVIDENCDGAIDEGFDIGGACFVGVGECRRSGAVTCAPGGAATSCSAVPAAPIAERCDDRDNDCDASIDNGCDDDGDGYCDAVTTFAPIGPTVDVCPLSTAATLDCNDANALVHPGVAETCYVDAIDFNCDGDINNGCPPCNVGVDNDFDGADQCTDCDDTNGRVRPGQGEVCDGLDNDCDGRLDQDFDFDGDGFTTCGTRPTGGLDPALVDCNDNPANGGVRFFPGACELCGTSLSCGDRGGTGLARDENCNGFFDEGCGNCSVADVDGDGITECAGDCDDGEDTVGPGQPELCDGLDTDCNTNTVANCDVGDLCDDGGGLFDENADQCSVNQFCVQPVGGGDGHCTSLCNTSEFAGGVGDGCAADEACSILLTPTANLTGCDTPGVGSIGAGDIGDDCNNDDDCRSGSCGGLGANRFCTDACTADGYCGDFATTGTVCQVSSVIGLCERPAAAEVDDTGTTCGPAGGDASCLHGPGSCVSMPSGARCTEPCCTNSDCPAGNFCSLNGPRIGGVNIDTISVCFEQAAANGGRQAGAACDTSAQCASEFCDSSLRICVDLCCNDSTCPAGLGCEIARTRVPGTAGSTFARVCLSLPPADGAPPLEKLP